MDRMRAPYTSADSSVLNYPLGNVDPSEQAGEVVSEVRLLQHEKENCRSISCVAQPESSGDNTSSSSSQSVSFLLPQNSLCFKCSSKSTIG